MTALDATCNVALDLLCESDYSFYMYLYFLSTSSHKVQVDVLLKSVETVDPTK